MTEKFDIAIIGAGSAGLTAADAALRFGLKVALLEKERIGGDCTWTGCVPSKALVQVAKVAQHVRTAGDYGVDAGTTKVDMHKVRDYVMQAIEEIYQHETPEVLQAEGIEVILGPAQFVDSHTLQIGERKIIAKKIIIATGSSPYVPPIQGIDEVDYLTNAEIFDNTRLPQHLLVMGAGPVGCEIGQAYQRLGAEVTLIDEALLPSEERQVANVIAKVFEKEGLNFVPGLVDSASQNGDEITLKVGKDEIRGDMLLVATGHKANVDGLNLQTAGITYSKDGIVVNPHLQTNIKHIYAVGDCVADNAQFTHLAGWQAFQAVRNASLPGNDPGFSETMPWAIFTDPEIARVGPTEEEACQQFGDKVQVAHMDLDRVDRAVTKNDLQGYIKILYLNNRRIIGATVVAERAGDTINEFVLAIDRKLKLEDVARSIHVYPTYGGSAQLLMSQSASANIISGPAGSVIKALAA
ncbi:MAG: FAD-binding protein [Chloroflexi bacterium]|nr:MAG: FAD-binding protein [Chloroflexota bacterium]MBL1196965.1 FAD-binding protein [Chloroflexota bacterium]NOH14261.1 FAD-dependent oxidoreductase [Chloroflexota bacterium]